MSKVNVPKATGEILERWRGLNVSWTSHLEGQLLTLLDAAIADPQQRRAIKDITSQTLWRWECDLPIVDEPKFVGEGVE